MRNDREVKIKHTSIIYNQKLHQVDIDRDTDYTIIGSRAGVKRQEISVTSLKGHRLLCQSVAPHRPVHLTSKHSPCSN